MDSPPIRLEQDGQLVVQGIDPFRGGMNLHVNVFASAAFRPQGRIG
jgi:hypothetical protein